MKNLVVGIAGGTASGKTTVCKALIKKFDIDTVTYLPCDSYYKDLTHVPFEKRGEVNLDHPDALEISLLIKHLRELETGQTIEVPVFDFVARQRSTQIYILDPRPVILVDGILALAEENLRNAIDIKVFLHEEPDVRFIRRLIRDITERGRTTESVVKQYLSSVRPMHNELVEPSKKYADIQGRSDQKTINKIYKVISDHLAKLAIRRCS